MYPHPSSTADSRYDRSAGLLLSASGRAPTSSLGQPGACPNDLKRAKAWPETHGLDAVAARYAAEPTSCCHHGASRRVQTQHWMVLYATAVILLALRILLID